MSKNLIRQPHAAVYYFHGKGWAMLAALLFAASSVCLPLPAVHAEEQGGSGEPVVTHKPDVFKRLWHVYPNKEGKAAAIEAWNSLEVSDEELDRMRAGFSEWRFSTEWTRERGKHVPPLATWLNERIWEKEPPPTAPLRIAELSTFLIQPIYLAPRLAFAISGAIVGGVIWPFDHATANKVWDPSLNAPWVWHEFVSGQD